MSGQVREKLARISVRPPGEWATRLEQEFPDDAQMRAQALLWLHCERDHERDESEAVDRFLAKARAVSGVVSEHVVRVVDVQWGDGQPYIVVELVGEHDAEKG